MLLAEDQRRVLDFARGLAEAKTPGRGPLLPFAQGFTKEDLDALRQAERDCEKVDLSEW